MDRMAATDLHVRPHTPLLCRHGSLAPSDHLTLAGPGALALRGLANQLALTLRTTGCFRYGSRGRMPFACRR